MKTSQPSVFRLFLFALFFFASSHVLAFPHLDSSSLKALTGISQKTAHTSNVRKSGGGECSMKEAPKPRNQVKKKRQITFDPSTQYVSTTGQYAWVAPTADDQRGPCPGLNALANHGYLPHNGVAPLNTIVQAVTSVYGMGDDLATFLAVYGTIFDGDALSLEPGFSIGGPTSAGQDILGGGGLLGTPQGLSGSHNKYESDASSGRGDLYLVGNDYLLQLDNFAQFYNTLLDDTAAPEQYNALLPFRKARFENSISTNPYFFYPQFAGVFVSPAGYSFPPAMMSNKSEKYPEGYLDKETFKSFFAVTGAPGSFSYKPGHEHIPDNWYKRAPSDPYTIPRFLVDVLNHGTQDPRLLSVGGNAGTPNSFVGVDIGNLTGGVFNAATLAEGNNLECFVFQLVQAEGPDLLTQVYEDVTQAFQTLTDNINSNLAGLGCPQLEAIDKSQYGIYPGYSKSGGAVKAKS